MTQKMRWGILGPGNIAAKFAEGLKVVPDAELYAVASRSKKRADEFGKRYGVAEERCFASYIELVRNPEVDIVYVAVPHSLHKELSLLCLQEGKAVLCEKPVALDAFETSEIINCAEKNGLFFMEAMWTRFLPAIRQVKGWIDERRIGEIMMIEADFGFKAEFNPQSRLFDPGLGGGALLDVGIYPVSIASYFYNKAPAAIESMAHIGRTKIDEQNVITFKYDNGGMAVLYSSLKTNTPQSAFILGTEGSIEIPMFWKAEGARMKTIQGEEACKTLFLGNGYEYEAMEAGDCIRKGRRESTIMPWHESIEVMKTMDSIKSKWQ